MPEMPNRKRMTEAEWNACADSRQMQEFLYDKMKGQPDKAEERKLRLFAVACCRRFWPSFRDERGQKVVEIAEYYADGLVGFEELREAWLQAAHAPERFPYNATLSIAEEQAVDASWDCAC